MACPYDLQYIGDGSTISGIADQDFTAAEIDTNGYDWPRMIQSGLWVPAPPPKKGRKAEAAPEPEPPAPAPAPAPEPAPDPPAPAGEPAPAPPAEEPNA